MEGLAGEDFQLSPMVTGLRHPARGNPAKSGKTGEGDAEAVTVFPLYKIPSR